MCYTSINYLHRKFTVELSQRLESDSPGANIAAGFWYGITCVQVTECLLVSQALFTVHPDNEIQRGFPD